MTHLFVLFRDLTVPFGTFVIIASVEHFTGRAALPSLTNGCFLRGALLVARETCLVPEMSLTFDARYSDGGEGARMPSHTGATVW